MKTSNLHLLLSQVFTGLLVSRSVFHTVFTGLAKLTLTLTALLYSQILFAATCQYDVMDEWNSGFRAEVSIINDSSASIDDWEVSWNWADGTSMQNGWEADISCSGSACSARGPAWAPSIGANETYSFGFIGAKGVSDSVADIIHISGAVCGVSPAEPPQPIIPIDPIGDPPEPVNPPVNPIEPPEVPEPSESPLVLWTLDGAQSNVQYVSTKSDHIGEVNVFEPGADGVSSFAGSIDSLGDVILSIDLNDIETGVDTRNERMLDFVFETELLPMAYITTSLDTDALSTMPVGASELQSLTANLTLHGVGQEVEAEVIVAKTSATSLVVSTVKPILIDSKDFEFASGIEVLRNLADLASISETVPVYFSLHYVANTEVNRPPLAKADEPSPPGSLIAEYIGSDGSELSALTILSWQDTSDNETGFIVRRREDGGLWSTVANIAQNSTSHLDEFSGPGEFFYKVIALNNGVPSDSSNIVSVIAQDVDPVEPIEPDEPVEPVEPTDEPVEPIDPPEPDGPVEPILPPEPPVIPDNPIAEGLEIYQAQCAACHAVDGSGVGTFPAIDTPRDIPTMISFITESMPLGNPRLCDEECAEDVSSYIATLWDDTDAPDVTEDDDNDVGVLACSAGPNSISYGARQLKILTRSEYQNSVEDLIGVDFDITESLSEDDKIGLFANNTHSSIVSSTYSNYLLVAEEIAEWSAERNFSPALNCGSIDQNCANSLVNDLAPRIFRRPLESEEVEVYSDMADGSLTGGDVKAGITLALEAMLSSPPFIYRHELGEANPDNPELDADGFELTSYEMATFLAYTFTGSTPDQTLLTAARNDSLRSDSEILNQAMRLSEQDRAKEVMGDFVGSWLGTEDLDIAAKNPEVWPGFEALVPHMKNEIRENFANVILDSDESFDSFYNADFTYLNEPLAQHYGISGVAGNQMRRVETADRGGILANGAFMARWGEAEDTSPILRSVRVRRRMLCQHELPDPPAGTFAAREERLEALSDILKDPETTTRLKTHLLTEGEPCSSCHSQYINPLGFGMEDFNTVGNVQTSDLNGNTIDAAGELYAPNDYNNTDEVAAFNGAQGLGMLMTTLPSAKSCISEQMFRYVTGVGHENIDVSNPEGPELADEESAGYTCEVENLTQTMMESSPRAMLERFSTLDAVRYRKAWSRD